MLFSLLHGKIHNHRCVTVVYNFCTITSFSLAEISEHNPWGTIQKINRDFIGMSSSSSRLQAIPLFEAYRLGTSILGMIQTAVGHQ